MSDLKCLLDVAPKVRKLWRLLDEVISSREEQPSVEEIEEHLRGMYEDLLAVSKNIPENRRVYTTARVYSGYFCLEAIGKDQLRLGLQVESYFRSPGIVIDHGLVQLLKLVR